MVHAASDDIQALEKLAAELEARGFTAYLAVPAGRVPGLAVRNPHALALSEDVMAQAGWFWWSWADRIAPVDDIDGAAARIASVLRAEVGGQ
jgi:hypothetical protein